MDISGTETLITGGAGFIGSNLACKLVKMGSRVTVVDALIKPYGGNLFNLKSAIKKIKFIKEDIRTKRAMEKLIQGKDLVFHLAAQTGRVISMKKPKLDFEINCLGTLSILNGIIKNKNKAKMIFASTRGVIGKPIYLPVDEKHPTNPRDIYGANKLLAENYCNIYGRKYGLRFTVLRLGNVYGPKCQIRSNHYGTVNLFIAYGLQKKLLPIYGDGTQTRDYIYIDDVLTAFLKASDKKADKEILFVGSGKEYSLLKIAKFIKKGIPDSNYQLVSYPTCLKKIDFLRFQIDSTKIAKLLNWKAVYSMEKGVLQTVEYYRKYLRYYM